MELSELIAYAEEIYQIQEDHKWADFPGFSVLCHPQTGKWVALLMRQWDTDTGTEIERCDLKCGNAVLFSHPQPFLSAPIRMHGSKWISIAFDRRTEPEVVFRLFDKAIQENAPYGYTIVLGSQFASMKAANQDTQGNQGKGLASDQGSYPEVDPGFSQGLGERIYRDTALPLSRRVDEPPRERIPERLREMKHLYEYGRESEESRAFNFYKQAVFMQDYEDDVPWSGDFVRYFPTYHDLTTRQLRGYFTWRTQMRKGNAQPIATSAAYIYIYELLNGIGADSPEDVLQKLRDFEVNYLDSGIGDKRMRTNLRRWMLEYAVVNDLPPETVRAYADPEMLARDEALCVLRKPETCSDDAVFEALAVFGGRTMAASPVVAMDPERGKHLFSEVWRTASAYGWQGKKLFPLCFGDQKTRRWYPLSNVVYYDRNQPADRDYVLNDCRSYRCKGTAWTVRAYEALSYNKALLRGFLHETDARLRRYLKTGRYLKEDPADEWVIPYIDIVIEAERRAIAEAARPKVTIDLSGLDQIRRDAAGTRDSLLTEEERGMSDEPQVEREMGVEPQVEREMADELQVERELSVEPQVEREMNAEPQAGCALPLDALQMQVLRALLAGEDVGPILQEHHRMPSITADEINELLFDEIGDTVILCEDDRLLLVDDYFEDIMELLGGKNHGGI